MERAFDFLSRNKWISQVGAVLVGLWALGVHHPWLGLLAIALGAASIIISRFGTNWAELSDGQKLAAVPGIVIGYVGLSLFIILLVIIFTALREEANR